MRTKPVDIGPLLTTAEVAARLRVSKRMVLNLLKRGELRSVKVGTDWGRTGGKHLVPARLVEEWLARQLRAA